MPGTAVSIMDSAGPAAAAAAATAAAWLALQRDGRRVTRRLQRLVGGRPRPAAAPARLDRAFAAARRAVGLLARGSARERREEVARSLPFFLDLMVIALDGGLNLHQAIEAVAPSLPEGALRAALDRAREDMRLGRPALEALEDMARNEGVDELNSIVRTLRIGQALGTPVGASLRQSARLVRQRRRQRLDELLGVLPLKLTFCALILFFPPILVLLLLPNVLNFVQGQW